MYTSLYASFRGESESGIGAASGCFVRACLLAARKRLSRKLDRFSTQKIPATAVISAAQPFTCAACVWASCAEIQTDAPHENATCSFARRNTVDPLRTMQSMQRSAFRA
jgi:hypothetical protein